MRGDVGVLGGFEIGPPPGANQVLDTPVLRRPVGAAQGVGEDPLEAVDFVLTRVEFASGNFEKCGA